MCPDQEIRHQNFKYQDNATDRQDLEVHQSFLDVQDNPALTLIARLWDHEVDCRSPPVNTANRYIDSIK